MSATSAPGNNPNPWRPFGEKMLLQSLLSQHPHWARFAATIASAKVRAMPDGDMGSVEFSGDDSRRFGGMLAETGYTDIDGVPAIIVGQSGALYEMDFWKTDFAPLECYPTPDLLAPVQYNTSP